MEYFLFNKALDYDRGFMENVSFKDGMLCMVDSGSGKKGIFISRVLDSRESRTRWQRFSARQVLFPNTAVEFRIYGTDEESRKDDIIMILKSGADSGGEKLKKMECFLKLRFANRKEMLLNQVTERYLWFSVTLWGNGERGPQISEIQVFFPWESFVSWLPELYSTGAGGFLERYLAIFQTVYQEADKKIREFPALLDLEASGDESLLWLSDWLSVSNRHSWPACRLRRYLLEGAAVFGRRGTKQGIKQIVYLYTGYRPYLIEPEDRPGEFIILISQEAVPSYQEYQALLRIVEEVKPAHMEAGLVILKEGVTLGRGSYLGINSVVMDYPPAVLGQMSQADNVILGG